MARPNDLSLSPPQRDRGYIGLSFSGGGYRATAFSLGTMALLHDLGLLRKARVMSSVSGGSLALGAYICAKAGVRPRQESDFDFYARYWQPLMLALGDEGLADAFVRLPLLLQGEKLILHAADATQRFLSSLLGAEALLGNEAITTMLRERSISPDYVFFNASNIVSLDLFRFGIQRGAVGEGGLVEPVYVLNRYYLQAEGGSVEANALYRHARHLRLGDCVAASFAFPGGFEPLIFPHDYFRPAQAASALAAAEAETAREHFSDSLICDRRPYVAFLDGGLYDNLGLASVEDIRRFLLRRTRDLLRGMPEERGKERQREREQPIHYVIATDVDNIQPGIGFYDEPSLDRQLVPSTPATPATRRRRGGGVPLAAILRALLGVGLVPLLLALALGVVLGLGGAALVWGLPVPWPVLVLAGALLLLLPLARLWRLLRRSRAAMAQLRRGLPRWLGVGARPPQSGSTSPTWRQRLGLSHAFDRRGVDNDLRSFAVRAVLGVVRGPDRSARLADLGAATLERRLGQLLPAFNGYLKRTRSLTYGYLQQTYEQVPPSAREDARGLAEAERCHLIRNMIFELIPGPDVDPSFASNLITLPVQSYRRQEAIQPMVPIMRKIRHADYVRDLLDRYAHRSVSQGPASPSAARSESMQLPLELLEMDDDLRRSLEDLNLSQAANHWSWLIANLEMDCRTPLPGAPNPTIGELVRDVSRLLSEAMDAANHDCHGAAEKMLRQRCSVKLGEDATSYSWIPLICEMATNLNTTLWVTGFRWYLPNQLHENRITAIGGWFVDPPPATDARPLLDLRAIPAPAAAITALAGYINTGFNLLEFFYASLGGSTPAHDRLVEILRHATPPIDQWDDVRRQDLVDLPFSLRHRCFETLRRQPGSNLPPGLVALLEPWLTIREGFPDSWRETFRGASG